MNVTTNEPDPGAFAGARIGNEIDIFTCFGADYSLSSLRATVLARQGSNDTLVFRPGCWLIAEDFSVPANFGVLVPAGTVFSIAAGKTLTLLGPAIGHSGTWNVGEGTLALARGVQNVGDPEGSRTLDRFGLPASRVQFESGFTAEDLSRQDDTRKGAALVGFQPPWPKTVGTTLQELASEAVSVARFGARGDGSDQTEQVQAAIEAIGSGQLIFPAGSYVLGTIRLRPGVILAGVGVGGTTIHARDANAPVFHATAPESNLGFFGLSGMLISCGLHTGVQAIRLEGSSPANRVVDVRINDLYLTGFPGTEMETGLYMRFCANSWIRRVFATHVHDGVQLVDCADSDILNCKVQLSSGRAYRVEGSPGPTPYDEGLRLVQCSSNGVHVGLSAKQVDWVSLEGCSFTTCEGGAASLENCSNWSIGGSEFAVGGTQRSAPGLTLDSGCARVQVNGSRFILNGDGMVLAGSQHVVAGNVLGFNGTGSGQGVVTNFADIRLTRATSCAITGNVCASGTIPSSIIEVPESGCDFNLITSNVCHSRVTTHGPNTVTVGVNLEY